VAGQRGSAVWPWKVSAVLPFGSSDYYAGPTQHGLSGG